MRIAVLGLALALGLAAGLGIAAAQVPVPGGGTVSVDQWYAYVCGNDGVVFKFVGNLAYPIIAVLVAGLLGNLKIVHAIPVLGPIVNVVGLNWAGWLRRAAEDAGNSVKSLALLLVLGSVLFLEACGGLPAPGATPAPPAAASSLQAFAVQVSAYNAKATADIQAVASGALAAGVAVGKSACGFASMGNGLFKAGAPAMALAGVDPGVGATEAAVMVGVELACPLIDAADPSKPVTPQVAAAVSQAVGAVPQITAALKAGADKVPDLGPAVNQ